MRTFLLSTDAPAAAYRRLPERERSTRGVTAEPAARRRCPATTGSHAERRARRSQGRAGIVLAVAVTLGLGALGFRAPHSATARAAGPDLEGSARAGKTTSHTQATRVSSPRGAADGSRASSLVAARPGRWETVWATAYCARCRHCETTYTTYTGTHARPGGVAVARVGTRVAPLGSKVYLPNQGWAKVDDVGGGVASNQIDIRVRTHAEAVQFGRRRMRIGLPARS